MLTTTIFLATFFGTLALILGLLFPLLLIPLRDDIRDIRRSVEPLKQIDEEARRLGLHEYFKTLMKGKEHDPLPPEKARRKEELLLKGRLYGLAQNEAEELKALLSEEAWSDFAAGLIGMIAVLGLLALIGAFIDSLTRRD